MIQFSLRQSISTLGGGTVGLDWYDVLGTLGLDCVDGGRGSVGLDMCQRRNSGPRGGAAVSLDCVSGGGTVGLDSVGGGGVVSLDCVSGGRGGTMGLD